MAPIAELIQQGATNLWVFIPTAILLGALHGLEPGHSKTMMASFIIAVKGTVGQAALLGLCAAFSHSLIVWALAAAALKFGNELIAEQAEPYLMLLSAVVVIGVAIWMFVRTRRDELAAKAHAHGHTHDHDHQHDHGHDYHHGDDHHHHAAEHAPLGDDDQTPLRGTKGDHCADCHVWAHGWAHTLPRIGHHTHDLPAPEAVHLGRGDGGQL
jgi:nickel/cobalt exporter